MMIFVFVVFWLVLVGFWLVVWVIVDIFMLYERLELNERFDEEDLERVVLLVFWLFVFFILVELFWLLFLFICEGILLFKFGLGDDNFLFLELCLFLWVFFKFFLMVFVCWIGCCSFFFFMFDFLVVFMLLFCDGLELILLELELLVFFWCCFNEILFFEFVLIWFMSWEDCKVFCLFIFFMVFLFFLLEFIMFFILICFKFLSFDWIELLFLLELVWKFMFDFWCVVFLLKGLLKIEYLYKKINVFKRVLYVY